MILLDELCADRGGRALRDLGRYGPNEIELHVTLLFPFVPAAGGRALCGRRSARLLRERPRPSFALARVRRSTAVVVYAAPDPDDQLTSADRRAHRPVPRDPTVRRRHRLAGPHATLAYPTATAPCSAGRAAPACRCEPARASLDRGVRAAPLARAGAAALRAMSFREDGALGGRLGRALPRDACASAPCSRGSSPGELRARLPRRRRTSRSRSRRCCATSTSAHARADPLAEPPLLRLLPVTGSEPGSSRSCSRRASTRWASSGAPRRLSRSSRR